MNQTDRTTINRINASKSTGPKTEAGKNRSSLNGRRHGLTGQAVLMPGEDQQAYLAHCDRVHAEYKPQGAIEAQFCQIAADTLWRLHRIAALETNLFALEFHRRQDHVTADHPETHLAVVGAYTVENIADELAKFSLYESRLNRTLHKNLEKLEQLQKARREREQLALAEAKAVRKMSTANNIPWNPADDGFAFSIEQIDRSIRRSDLVHEAFVFASAA